MDLHQDKTLFKQLSNVTSSWKKIPEEAIARDYFITREQKRAFRDIGE